jgi:hypothetical protein
MQQETNFQSCCAEIIEYLSLRCVGELKTRLRFDDKLLINNHVDSLNAKHMALVRYVDTDLSRDSMASGEQLTFERHHVHVLEKAESQCVIDLEEGPNYGAGESFLNQFDSGHATRCNRTCSDHLTKPLPRRSLFSRGAIGQIRFIRRIRSNL